MRAFLFPLYRRVHWFAAACIVASTFSPSLNGAEATFKLIETNKRSSLPESWVDNALQVQVVNAQGKGVRDQEVIFQTLRKAEPLLAETRSGPLTKRLVVRTDHQGIATAQCQFPDHLVKTAQIMAIFDGKVITFRLLADDRYRPQYNNLPAPGRIRFTIPEDGRIRLDWKDNAEDERGYVIARYVDGDGWRVVAQLPPNTERWTDPDAELGQTHRYTVEPVH